MSEIVAHSAVWIIHGTLPSQTDVYIIKITKQAGFFLLQKCRYANEQTCK